MLFNPKNKKVKYTLISLSLVFILVSFGIFWPQMASAGPKELFTELLGNLLYKIAELLGRLLVAVIQMMIAIIQYNDFGQATAVQKGWVIIRDVCNMFFIAVLLMIAFGTIFKWETYRYNKLLGRFILMAFLINFSKFIALFLIDVSQVIMMTFVNAFSDIAAGNLVAAFGLEDMFRMMKTGTGDVNFSGVVGALLLAIILLIIAILTIFTITIVLLMRILVLWLLIILSPLAYFLRTWPGSGEKASSMWWKEFGRNLVNGPIIAFFLWLSLSIISTQGADNVASTELGFKKVNTEEQSGVIEYEENTALQEFGASTGGKFYTTISEISSSDRLLSFLISISLLLGSLMVAQKMASAGGQMAGTVLGKVKTGLTKAAKLGAAGVTGGAIGMGLAAGRKKIFGAGKFLASRGKGLAARKLIHERQGPVGKTLKFFTPTFWQGVGQRAEILDKDAKEQTKGYGQEWWEKKFKGPRATTPHEERALYGVVHGKRSKINDNIKAAGDDRKAMQQEGLRVLSEGGHEGDLEKMAFYSEIKSRGNWDDLWEEIAQNMHEDPEVAAKIPPEIRDELLHFNETTSANLAAYFMGLDNDKFNPIKITKNLLNSETDPAKKAIADKLLQKDPETGLDATVSAELRNELSQDEKDYFKSIEQKAIEKAVYNAENKSNKMEKMKLKTMAMGGVEARNTGHFEQLHSMIDPRSGIAHMITADQAFEESEGEIGKMGTRDLIRKVVPYLWQSKIWDPKRKKFRIMTDKKYQTVFQRKFMEQILHAGMGRDFQHMQGRNPKFTMGVESMVGFMDANLYNDGSFYDGADQLYNEDKKVEELPRDENGEIDEEKMDDNMIEYYKRAKEKGKNWDDNRIITYMKRKRRELSEKRLEGMLTENPVVGDYFWRFNFHGQASSDRPTPFSQAGRGLGMAYNDEIMDNKEEFMAQVVQQRKNLKGELEDKLETGKVKPEEKQEELKKIDNYTEAAVNYWNSKRKKNLVTESEISDLKNEAKPSSMVDINEEKQKNTRQMVEEQGQAFFSSDEYLNNQDKYYNQDTYKTNEKIAQKLKKQANLNSMSGTKSALASAEKGQSAALAVNFEDSALEDLNLKGAGANLKGEEMTKAIGKIGEKYLEELIAKNEDLSDKEKKTEEQMAQEVENFKDNLKNASSLRLVNKNRAGVDVRHVLTHENYHDQIDKKVESGDLDLGNEWNIMSEEEQNSVKEELKNQGWNVDSMDNEEIMKEYLAEGLTNQTRYAQEGGTKLKAIHFDKLKESGIDVKGEVAQEIPEIQEIEETPSIKKLAGQAVAKKVSSAIKFPFKSLSNKLKDRKQTEEYKSNKTEALTNNQEVNKIKKEAEIKTGQRDIKSQQRKREEDKLKQLKNQTAPEISQLNNQIKEYSERAREEASQGNVSKARDFHQKADQAREEARNKSEKIKEQEGYVDKARQEEGKAATQAKKAQDKLKNSQSSQGRSIEKVQKSRYGGEKEYNEHVEKAVSQGKENMGEDTYRKELKEKIKYWKNQVGRGTAEMDITARLEMDDLKNQLRVLDTQSAEAEVSFDTKVKEAGGLDNLSNQLKKEISNIGRRINIAPENQKVELKADKEKLEAELNKVDTQINDIDARIEVGIENSGSLDNYNNELEKKINNKVKELEKAPDDQKKDIKVELKSLRHEKDKVEEKISVQEEEKLKQKSKKQKTDKADEHLIKASKYEDQAKTSQESGKFAEAKELKEKAAKERKVAEDIKKEKIKVEVEPEIKAKAAKAEDINIEAIPPQIINAMQSGQLSTPVSQLSQIEQQLSLPEEGIIDPKIFDDMVEDMRSALKNFENSIQSVTDSLSSADKKSVSKTIEELSSGLKKQIKNYTPNQANDRSTQYKFNYHLFNLTNAIRKLVNKNQSSGSSSNDKKQ